MATVNKEETRNDSAASSAVDVPRDTGLPPQNNNDLPASPPCRCECSSSSSVTERGPCPCPCPCQNCTGKTTATAAGGDGAREAGGRGCNCGGSMDDDGDESSPAPAPSPALEGAWAPQPGSIEVENPVEAVFAVLLLLFLGSD